ncbi:unnamed protein product, partial [Prunus brigantina]
MWDWFGGLQVLGEVGYQFSAVCASSFIALMESVDEIAQGISNALAISEEEAVEIVSLEDLDSLRAERFLLVGRLLMTKVFHRDSLVGIMKSIWHTREGFTVVPLEDPQCMLFSFQNDFDRRKVMRGAPWTFDRSLLVLAFTDGSVDPMTVPLEIQNFWVRIRRIPPIFLTPALGEKIGNVVTEQFGRWKTQIKDVFSIRVVSGLKGKAFGLGPCSRLQAQAKPQRDQMSGVVRSFGEAFGTFEGGVTPLEEEHQTTFLLAAGVSKKRRFMGKEVDELTIPKTKSHAEQQFCEGQVAVGKRKVVKVGVQRGRGRPPKPGGLALLWQHGVKVSIRSFSSGHIDALIEDGYSGPWVVGGDFNEVLEINEYLGRRYRPMSQMRDFGMALEDCGLTSMKYKGYKFTWTNNRTGDDRVQLRLDRGVANAAFFQVFPGAIVDHVNSLVSDHLPVFIHFGGSDSVRWARRFMFEEMWTEVEGCTETVVQAWGEEQGDVVTKLKACQQSLQVWNKSKVGHIPMQIRQIQGQLDGLKRKQQTDEVMRCQRRLAGDLDRLLAREEMIWQQRSRVSWLKYGDRNTKFFHAQAKQRGRRNFMQGIFSEHDVWTTSNEGVGSIFCEYFKTLFTTSGENDFSTVLAAVNPKVTREHNERLSQPFTRVELEDVLSKMFPTKYPGLDGMPALFYQRYWHVLGNDVVSFCLNVLNGGASVREINHTLITLIPKVDNPTRVTEYRPISLCSVLYKLISKTLVNRMKGIMQDVISEYQSAFVPSRLITDNIIAAFESIHAIQKRGGSALKKMILKLDMSKAYDRVEWNFLSCMMRKLGFNNRWVDLIMDCVSTVSFSVKVRRAAMGSITPSRGLRQGDPLSPYLFLICAEGLSALLSQAQSTKQIHGVAVARGAPTLSHLFFADDSLLFCNAHLSDCYNLKLLLRVYERASGQQINFAKSAATFSPKTDPIMKCLISSMLGVRIVDCHTRYLGLPTISGRSKHRLFNYVRDMLWNKLHMWNAKLLSTAGKEVLIKAVAQALPTYTMGVFQLPKSLCHDLSAMVARFWWGKSGKRSIHWKSWRNLCRPKCLGGLGFKIFEAFNQAMVAKQAWRLLENPSSLVGRILRARYFPNGDFLTAGYGQSPSLIWRSILWGRQVIENGLIWRIGGGTSVRVFHDKWIPKPYTFSPLINRGLPLEAKVSELITESGGWNRSLLDLSFCDEDCSAILSIPLPSVGSLEDKRFWFFSKNGKYSVRTGYRVALRLC